MQPQRRPGKVGLPQNRSDSKFDWRQGRGRGRERQGKRQQTGSRATTDNLTHGRRRLSASGVDCTQRFALGVVLVLLLSMWLLFRNNNIQWGGRSGSTNRDDEALFCPRGRILDGSGGLADAISDQSRAKVQVPNEDPDGVMPIATNTFTIATYNAEWLFDGFDDQHRSWESADAHISAVAGVLASLDADLVNVVELEDCNVLSRVAGEVVKKQPKSQPSLQPPVQTQPLRHTEQRFVYVPQSADSASRQSVGVMSRFPLLAPGAKRSNKRVAYPVDGSQCQYIDPSGRHRSSGVSKHWFGILRFEPDLEVLIVGVHFKARVNHPPSCAQREAQARVVADIVRRHRGDASSTSNGGGKTKHGNPTNGTHGRKPKRREVIVLGDFNDFDGQVLDSVDNRPNSDVLRVLTDNLGLTSVYTRIPKHQRTSWVGDKWWPQSAMDFILVSEGMLHRLEKAWVEQGSIAQGVSDHYPLVARFRMTEK